RFAVGVAGGVCCSGLGENRTPALHSPPGIQDRQGIPDSAAADAGGGTALPRRGPGTTRSNTAKGHTRFSVGGVAVGLSLLGRALLAPTEARAAGGARALLRRAGFGRRLPSLGASLPAADRVSCRRGDVHSSDPAGHSL